MIFNEVLSPIFFTILDHPLTGATTAYISSLIFTKEELFVIELVAQKKEIRNQELKPWKNTIRAKRPEGKDARTRCARYIFFPPTRNLLGHKPTKERDAL